MGKTILISSHILHELAELCNMVGIIERGKLLFAGSVREALHRAKVGHIIHIGVVDRVTQAAELLAKVPGVKKVSLIDADVHGGATPNGKGAGAVGAATGPRLPPHQVRGGGGQPGDRVHAPDQGDGAVGARQRGKPAAGNPGSPGSGRKRAPSACAWAICRALPPSQHAVERSPSSAGRFRR
jgi:hypothetical protein